MKSFSSISIKFTSRYLAILGILLLASGLGTYFSLSKRMYANLDTTLRQRALQIAKFKGVINIIAGRTFEGEPGELLSFYYYADDRLAHISYADREEDREDLRAEVSPELIDQVLKTGNSLFSFVSSEKDENLRLYLTPYSPPAQAAELDLHRPQPQPPNSAGEGAVAHPDRTKEIQDIDHAVLVIARPTTAIDLALNQLAQILVIVLPLTLLLMGCCGIFFLRIVLRPVQSITDTAREIEASDLNRRIEVTTKDELGRLAATINHMIARLEKAFLRQKELTGDASHELRAPLAVIQAEATLALQRERDPKSYQKSLAVITDEADHMSTIIGQLLFLARADYAKEQAHLETLELAPFLHDLGNSFEPLCTDKQQTLNMDQIGSAAITGDKNLLRRVVMNLLLNAIQYTPEGGVITVSLTSREGMARICISDTGIGISEENLPHIFKRFYRVDKARSRESGGSGLGLAICTQIVDLHQGQIEVSSQLDQGTCFVVSIPLAR
jgi:heavy metal sensor kinase